MAPGPGTARPAARHLYVHIPFCRSRCAYCDFASEPIGPHLRAGRVETYVERLRRELRERAGVGGPPRAFDTVYVGGGTPSVLPEALLLPFVRELADLQKGSADPELTLEANPGTVDASLLGKLVEAGVNRLSLGVQSFEPRCRATLGRHTKDSEIEDAVRTLRRATRSGELTGWNIDLVFGIPGQSWPEAAADIDAAAAAGPTHASLYDLTYTPAFAARVEARVGAGAREAAGAFAEQHLAGAVARLEDRGFRRYEVSNFALPGHECRHNLAYWRGEDYVGVGAGAVSTVGEERRTNPSSVSAYVSGEAARFEPVPPAVRLWEKAMLGLRTTEGVAEEEVLPVLDASARDRLLAQDCLWRHCGRLRLNPAFLDVSNTVISTLLGTPGES